MKTSRTSGEPFSQTALTYLHQLAAERALNPDIVNDDGMLDFFLEATTSQSKAMRFGTEQEENALDLYCKLRKMDMISPGLCRSYRMPFLASSPDGIIVERGIDGCLEVKCPSLSTFSQYVSDVHDGESLLKVNPDYFFQCQAHMLCTGAQFCDFIVYCPFVVNPIHIVRIERDDSACLRIEERAKLAEEYILKFYNHLKTA